MGHTGLAQVSARSSVLVPRPGSSEPAVRPLACPTKCVEVLQGACIVLGNVTTVSVLRVRVSAGWLHAICVLLWPGACRATGCTASRRTSG